MTSNITALVPRPKHQPSRPLLPSLYHLSAWVQSFKAGVWYHGKLEKNSGAHNIYEWLCGPLHLSVTRNEGKMGLWPPATFWNADRAIKLGNANEISW